MLFCCFLDLLYQFLIQLSSVFFESFLRLPFVAEVLLSNRVQILRRVSHGSHFLSSSYVFIIAFCFRLVKRFFEIFYFFLSAVFFLFRIAVARGSLLPYCGSPWRSPLLLPCKYIIADAFSIVNSFSDSLFLKLSDNSRCPCELVPPNQH